MRKGKVGTQGLIELSCSMSCQVSDCPPCMCQGQASLSQAALEGVPPSSQLNPFASGKLTATGVPLRAVGGPWRLGQNYFLL